MINYTHLWFVPARKASLMYVISNKTKPRFVRSFEDIESPNSLKITKQQLPKLNYQCNRDILSHNSISNTTTTNTLFVDVSNYTQEILVSDNNASNNNLQATAMDLTKSI